MERKASDRLAPLAGAAPSDILSGGLDRPLLRLAVPLFVGYCAHLAFNWLNAWFVGHLSEEALAAVGATAYVLWGMISLAEVAAVGTMALVSRAVGARDPRDAGAAAVTGVGLALLIGLVLGQTGNVLSPLLVRALGLDGATAALATDYLRVLFWLGYPALSVFLALEAVCRGAGRTGPSMAILGASFALNGLLDWVLIFGWGPVPALGVEGAAVATGLARSVGAVALLAWVLVHHRDLGLAWPGWRVDLRRLAAIVRIGVPASAAGLGFAGIYVALNALTATFGTAAVAALGVGLRLEGLAFIICQAFGRAAATLAGQNLGAQQPERARAAVRRAIRLGCLVMAPMTVVMIAGADLVAHAFVPTQPDVAVAAASYLRIAGLALFGMVLEVVLENVAGGVGDTVPAMAIEVVGTALRIPIALGLARLGLGYEAVWWSVASTCLLKGLAFEVWFRRTRWGCSPPAA